MMSDNKINKIVDRILQENYYADMLGSDFKQQQRNYIIKQQILRDKLIDSIMQVIKTEFNNVNIKRETLGFLVDPIVSNLNRWSRK